MCIYFIFKISVEWSERRLHHIMLHISNLDEILKCAERQ